MKVIKISLKVTVIVIIIALILIVGFYTYSYYLINKNYTSDNIFSSAYHEAGHAFMDEYLYPNSVKKVEIYRHPPIKYVIGFRIVLGETFNSVNKNVPDKELIPLYKNYVLILLSGNLSSMAYCGSNIDNMSDNGILFSLGGSNSDNDKLYNVVLSKLYKLETNGDWNKLSSNEKNIYYSKTVEPLRIQACKIILNNKKTIEKIALKLFNNKKGILIGDEVRTIIKGK